MAQQAFIEMKTDFFSLMTDQSKTNVSQSYLYDLVSITYLSYLDYQSKNIVSVLSI